MAALVQDLVASHIPFSSQSFSGFCRLRNTSSKIVVCRLRDRRSVRISDRGTLQPFWSKIESRNRRACGILPLFANQERWSPCGTVGFAISDSAEVDCFDEDDYKLERGKKDVALELLEGMGEVLKGSSRVVVSLVVVFALLWGMLGVPLQAQARPMRAPPVGTVQTVQVAPRPAAPAEEPAQVPSTPAKSSSSKPGVDLAPPRISYTEFLSMVEGGKGVRVTRIFIERNRANVMLEQPIDNYSVIAGSSWLDKSYLAQLKGAEGRWLPSQHFVVDLPVLDSALLKSFTTRGIQVVVEPVKEGLLGRLVGLAEPLLLVGLVLLYFGSNDSGLGGVLKNKAKLYKEGNSGVSFDDVAGCDEAKEELMEVVDFLKSSERYRKLGARVPKGVLLCGPAGTGKTLLAKAVAGEAGVAFFSISGSEFVEIFGGLGASRVRKIFSDCRKKAPAILFIDELDAIGRTRGGGGGGGAGPRDGYSEEREQTLNQLLTEMDGFEGAGSKPVIMLGATNRPEVLDPALRRPGRFDRTVVVDRPDKRGREAVLKIHLKGVKFSQDLDVSDIAGSTVGFTGADLANLVNEAALLAARQGQEEVGREQLMEAAERTMAGLARKSLRISEVERRTVAYHECGHALVGALAGGNGTTITKISVIPRGTGALGYTLNQPDEDRYLMGEDDMRSFIAVALGGRAAERLVFGRLTSGAADDLQRATDYADRMVTLYGMCGNVGPRALQSLRRSYLEEAGYMPAGINGGPEMRKKVDGEIDSILRAADELCEEVLVSNRELLEEMAEKLLVDEVLQGETLNGFLGRAKKSEAVSQWIRTGELLLDRKEGDSISMDTNGRAVA